jgi:PhnB protein
MLYKSTVIERSPNMAVKPIPDGYSAVTPYLTVKGAAAAIEFYKQAFGAEQILRLDAPDGSVAHAEIRIGGAVIMLSEENRDWGTTSPTTLGGTASAIMLYVTDADVVFNRAVAAGATVKMPIADQFYGDRSGSIVDPYGHQWSIATHIEDVSPEEIDRRAAKMFGGA